MPKDQDLSATNPSRRTIIQGAAWSVPAIALAVSAPSAAASGLATYTFTTSGSGVDQGFTCFTLPATAQNITYDISGAAGGSVDGVRGGNGERRTGTLTAPTVDTTFTLVAGGHGGTPQQTTTAWPGDTYADAATIGQGWGAGGPSSYGQIPSPSFDINRARYGGGGGGGSAILAIPQAQPYSLTMVVAGGGGAGSFGVAVVGEAPQGASFNFDGSRGGDAGGAVSLDAPDAVATWTQAPLPGNGAPVTMTVLGGRGGPANPTYPNGGLGSPSATFTGPLSPGDTYSIDGYQGSVGQNDPLVSISPGDGREGAFGLMVATWPLGGTTTTYGVGGGGGGGGWAAGGSGGASGFSHDNRIIALAGSGGGAGSGYTAPFTINGAVATNTGSSAGALGNTGQPGDTVAHPGWATVTFQAPVGLTLGGGC